MYPLQTQHLTSAGEKGKFRGSGLGFVGLKVQCQAWYIDV